MRLDEGRSVAALSPGATFKRQRKDRGCGVCWMARDGADRRLRSTKGLIGAHGASPWRVAKGRVGGQVAKSCENEPCPGILPMSPVNESDDESLCRRAFTTPKERGSEYEE